MNLLRLMTLGLAIAWPAPMFAAQKFRTDINPALRYYQAFLEAPNLPEPDHEYLLVVDWRGRTLEKRIGELISRYDYQFRFLREAAKAEVPCDWGIDLTEGPDALLPALARAKAVAQTTRLRVMWHLQNGRQAEARDDLLATFTMGRNVSRDGVLISSLVQMAIENIIESIVAENFFQWQPEILKQIADGLESAPARGTVAQCIPAEKHSFHDWLLRKVHEIQLEPASDNATISERLSQLFSRIIGEGDSDSEFGARVMQAAGGNIEGVLRLVRELGPLYENVAVLMTLPHGPFEEQMTQFMSEASKNPNPFVQKLFTVFGKCRVKEFAAVVKQAMVQAGVEYKLHGEAGLKRVKDPCGDGPFEVRRFQFDGEDRGFELKSSFNGRGHEEVLIFLEKNSPPIFLEGKNAGKPIPNGK